MVTPISTDVVDEIAQYLRDSETDDIDVADIRTHLAQLHGAGWDTEEDLCSIACVILSNNMLANAQHETGRQYELIGWPTPGYSLELTPRPERAPPQQPDVGHLPDLVGTALSIAAIAAGIGIVLPSAVGQIPEYGRYLLNSLGFVAGICATYSALWLLGRYCHRKGLLHDIPEREADDLGWQLILAVLSQKTGPYRLILSSICIIVLIMVIVYCLVQVG